MKQIKLSGTKNSNLCFLVSNKDYKKVVKYRWYSHPSGYVSNSCVGLLHHLILGKPENGYEVNHKNLNKLDNTRKNLEFLTIKENRQNKLPYKAYKTRPYKNKGAYKRGEHFQAQIRTKSKTVYLGTFNEAHEATLACQNYINKEGLKNRIFI